MSQANPHQIFQSFKAFDETKQNFIEYRIQYLPEDCFDAALDLLVSDYMPDETFSACLGLHRDANTIAAFRRLWLKEMGSKLSIGCFTGEQLVAVDVLSIYHKHDTFDCEKGDAKLNKLYEILGFIAKKSDIFRRFDVDRVLFDHGLCTKKSHRHRGIAVEMLKARLPIMKKLGIKLTAADFSVIGSQKASEKAGFKEIFSMSYKELNDVFPNVGLSNAPNDRVISKVMFGDD